MPELFVSIRSHHFVVTRITPRGRPVVDTFSRKMVQYGFSRDMYNKSVYGPLKVFAAATKDRQEYRFHINMLAEFKIHLKVHNVIDDMVEYEYVAVPEPVTAEFKIKPHWSDRDYQTPVIDYIIDNDPPLAKFVSLATGRGKSYCTMRAMETLKCRTLIIVKPMYMIKWVEDMERTFENISQDIVMVSGSKQLMALLSIAEAGELTSKVIVISNKTLQNWIKLYEKFREETLDMGYACLPDKLCEILGVGIRLIDEVHQDFYLNFKISCYTNVMRSISLSATLLSDDDFMNRMYEVAYPAVSRYKGQAHRKYISAKAVIYKLKRPDLIRTKDYATGNYSHHLFEQSVLRHSDTKKNYFGLINKIVEEGYLKDYKKGQKLIIFCISIDMCTELVKYLKNKHNKLDIRRYVEEDPYDNVISADIRVTTLQSAGTAIDIDNLTTTILTIAVSSSQANIQGLGRLRELKDGSTPQFWYFVCENIPKHIEYHERKRGMLEDRALNYKSIFIPDAI